MQLNNWKIFDKSGSQLNWFADSYINLTFSSDSSASNASGYLITDVSGIVIDAEITNSGYYYNPASTQVSYRYTFGNPILISIPSSEASIGFIDVSIFNPEPVSTTGIGSMYNFDVSTVFTYPSTVYTGAIFLEPVSQGLVETEHLYIFELINGDYIRPYDPSTSSLKIQMYGDETEIQLFTINEEEQTVDWTDTLYYELDTYALSTPISINVGFRAEDEGVYERKLRIYNTVGGVDYLMAEILVNAESIGEDERFRTLLGNFGLPDPKDFPKLFKEVDINEDLPDYKIVNPKSKQMILEHSEIMPYVGTYKALINAIKWLGYEDIYVREWFKNVKQNKKLSLIVPYNAKDRTQTILKFSPDERRQIKKLNQLSLNYCLTRETGEIDEWGTPETENCYEYNIQEVFTKLVSLKNWLEKNIIGVNARIIDITGEGIYFERYINLIYANQNHGFDYYDSQTITALTSPNNSELVAGDSSINLTLLELERTNIGSLNYKFTDFIDYVWNSSDGTTTYYDSSVYQSDPSLYLEVGPPISFPFVGIKDIQYKASLLKESGTIPATHVSKPLWIYDEAVNFYNIFDEDRPAVPETEAGAVFYDSSINVDFRLERAYIKDASNPNWDASSAYTIYPNQYIDLNAGASTYLVSDISVAIISGSGWVEDVCSGITSFNITLDPCYFFLDTSIYVTADTSVLIQSSVYLNWILESSTGQKLFFDDKVNLTPSPGGKARYANTDTWPATQPSGVVRPVNNYNEILLSFENFQTIDSSGNTFSFPTDKLYFMEIFDGRVILDPINAKEIEISGLLDFDGVNDNVRMYPQPAIEGTNTFTFNAYFESFTADTSVFIMFSCGGDNTDYLMISYRPAVEQLFVAAKRISGMSNYDISHLIDKHAFIEIEKGVGTITSIKANGEDLTLLSSGLTGPFATTETYVGSHPVPATWFKLNHALVWDLTLEGKNHWAGYPAGNTNGAWVDTIGVLDGTVLGSPSTIDLSYPDPNYGKEMVYNIVYNNYDNEQYISTSIEYFSPRMPLYVVDPSIYYWADPSGLSGGDDPNVLAIDNSIYSMTVHHTGDYSYKAYAWDGYNVLYTNQGKKVHQVWIKTPTLNALIDVPDNISPIDEASTWMNSDDVNILLTNNKYPIFDRTPSYRDLRIEYDSSNKSYEIIPNMTYFQVIEDWGNYNRYFNLTERVSSISGSTITINSIDVSFYPGDDIILALMDKGSYLAIEEASTHITSVTNVIEGVDVSVDSVPVNMVIDSSHDVYAINDTRRFTANPSNLYDSSTFMIDISGNFKENQLVNIIISDACTGYEWGSSYRLKETPVGSTHIFYKLFPEFILDDPSRYTLYAKYAFSTPVNYIMDSTSINQDDTSIYIYSGDYRENFLDSTFKIMNLPFNHEDVIDQWGSVSIKKELLTNWTNHGFASFISSGTEITEATNLGGDPSDYCQSNTFSVAGGTTIDISIYFTNIGFSNVIPIFYIQEIGGNDSSTEYTIVDPAFGGGTQNNFAHVLDPSTTSAYLRFVDGSPLGMNWEAGTSVMGSLNYYYYDRPITVDASTLVILKVDYDASSYMLNQKNIWTIQDNVTKDTIIRVHNESVPFIFDTPGYYDILTESYDYYGNVSRKRFDGFIKIV